MRVLVTGATGLIGSVLVRHLLAQGDEVHILRRATSRLDLLGQTTHDIAHHLGDVTDAPSVDAAMKDIEQVYHVAAYIGFGGARVRRTLHEVNVRGTAHVVNAALAAGVERLVHTSSMAAFGCPEPADEPVNEATPWRASRTHSAYALSKYHAELEVYRGIAEGLDAVLVNPALVFGLGRPGENTRQIIDRVRFGKAPFYPAGGTNVVDVEDVAAGHVAAMQRGITGERYFLGGENLSWHALLETLAEALGVRPPRRRMPPAAALTLAYIVEVASFFTRIPPAFTREMARNAARFYRYDNRKAISELGCSFRPFEATARRLAEALTPPSWGHLPP